jgi:LssY C-terminus
VWIGQVSRDIGVRFTTRTPFLTTHAIDPNIDEARDYVLEDLLVTGALERWGLVRGVGEAEPDKPRTNLTGDKYFTDGLRLIVFVSASHRAMTDVEQLEWEPVPFH